MCTRLERMPSQRGSELAELAPSMFAIFIIFFFPLINIGTIALRYGLLLATCREATHASATAHSFTSGSTGRPSSQEIALPTAREYAERFSGIAIQAVQLKIIIVDRTSQTLTVKEQMLSAPANTQSNSYFIETTVLADLSPLVDYDLPTFLDIPGLSSPWRTSVSMRQFVEYPQGLNE